MNVPHTTVHSVLISTCLLVSFLSFTSTAQDLLPLCNATAGSYTQGSQYESNLNLVLTSLVSNVTSDGFYMTSSGTKPNTVYGLLQCRGDVSSKDCSICANISALEIVQQCSNLKQALISSDNCKLIYADYHFFSTAIVDQSLCASGDLETSNPVLFNMLSRYLMHNLSSKAASDTKKFSTGRIAFNDSVTIYGLVQCNRYLSTKACSTCLQAMISGITKCANNYRSGKESSISCDIRYEIYPFYASSSQSPSLTLPDLHSPIVNDNSTTRTNNTSSNRHGKKNRLRNIILIVIPVVIASLLILTIYICFQLRKNVKNIFGTKEDGIKCMESENESMESCIFDLSTLRIATKNFSNDYKIGEGGFGPVYKGELPDGREIAVKRLAQRSGQGLEELKTEVVLLAKLMHRNLVTLLGFCIEEEEKLLIYEYIPNGSLDQMLFDHYKCSQLGWDKRYNIIIGVARGLLYLHHDSQIRIVHRDLKASNILLDETMNPKISDFGLARHFGESQVVDNTKRIAGTYGYMAPEYAIRGQYSTKSDIFSFGVLVLEIISGRKNSSFHGSTNLLSYTWHCWNDGIALKIVDPTLGGQWSQSEILRCIQLGLLCVQQDAYSRPTMTEIFLWINSYSVACRIPSRPAYFVEKIGTESYVTNTTSSSGDLQSDKTLMRNSQKSVNEVTSTDIYPR